MIAAVCFIAPSTCLAAAYEESTPFVGVRHLHEMLSVPRLLDVHVLEIDPHAAGIDFYTTPSNGSAAGETVAQTTRSFVTQNDLQIGVNASFFAYVSGANMNIEGLAASRGDVYSDFQADRLAAFNVSADHVAAVIQSTLGAGSAHTPNVPLYNAVGGNALILLDGVNAANPADTSLHPRTAAGVTADGKILLMTVDGRNTGHSLGVSTPELGDLMAQFGARDAINLDGGGSTTLVMADPVPRVVNVPVGVNNVPGSERSVGNNFGVYATAYAAPTNNRFVFSDFAGGDPGYFSWPLTASGSTQGILATSQAQIGGSGSPSSPGSERLIIRDDPNVSSGPENPDGWFLRYLASAPGATVPASRTASEIRPAEGVVGLWAKTTSPDVRVAIALDDTNNVTADRGRQQPLIADGAWHRYKWNLNDPAQWEGWFQGDGVISGPDFSLDSIQFFGPNADAVVYLDDVYHETIPPFTPRPEDFDHDGDVDGRDLALWRRNFGVNSLSDANGDGVSDGNDFLSWQRAMGAGPSTPQFVPETSSGTLALSVVVLLAASIPRKA